MRKIEILVKRVGEAPEVMEIEHSLVNMQKIVGGYLEVVGLPNGIDMWLNEEGLLVGMKDNLAVVMNGRITHQIVGNVFFAAHDKEGNTIGLNEYQMMWIKTKLIPTGQTLSLEGGDKLELWAVMA